MATTYAIPDGRVAMAATLYNGTGATASISNAVNGVSFQPDFVWAKARSSAESHRLADSVRGATKVLYSNLTNAEATEATGITAFASNGFTLGSGTPNGSGITYVGWQWKAGGTAVSNTAGSITSSVSANPTAGFSVVTYTGTGSNATVGHGLGVAPSMVITKNRAASANWLVYHASLGATQYLGLNQTISAQTNIVAWNNTAPTSTVFSIGTDSSVNGSSNTMVAYCFAPVAGYSAFGKYTGNGSADGPFVYTGFRPRFVMMKATDATFANDWVIIDSMRKTANEDGVGLRPNLSSVEFDDSGTGTNAISIDILSNGFKLRGTSGRINGSGSNVIYACFAENPFKYANAR